jgi:hypothetical protein
MSFDLNIDNYTKQELVSLFDLPPNYNNNILELKESKLRENIMKNTEINKDTQIKTVNFLVKAKKILLNNFFVGYLMNCLGLHFMHLLFILGKNRWCFFAIFLYLKKSE